MTFFSFPKNIHEIFGLKQGRRQPGNPGGNAVGVTEDSGSTLSERFLPTLVRNSVQLTGETSAALLDATGRKILRLLPGDHDLSRVPAGVYFVTGRSGRDIRRIVIQE